MYENFYNLSGKPFRLKPDPRFLFTSRVHKRALSYLRYGLTQGEGIVVVTGHVGAGKTTLLRALIEDMDTDVVAAEMAATPLAARELIERIGAALGIVHSGLHHTVILKRVEDFFKARINEGIRVALMIDEAQNLNQEALEELRMLANLEHKGQPYFQVFLIGQEELRQTLHAPGMEQFQQRVISSFHLSPMSSDETLGYIQHRLRLVGWNGDPDFSPEAIDEIHRYAAGIPRRINTLCDRLLLFGFLEERHSFDAQAVRLVSDELLEELRAGNTSIPIQPEELDQQCGLNLEQVNRQFSQLSETLDTLLERMAQQLTLPDRLARLEECISQLEERLPQESPEPVSVQREQALETARI